MKVLLVQQQVDDTLDFMSGTTLAHLMFGSQPNIAGRLAKGNSCVVGANLVFALSEILYLLRGRIKGRDYCFK